MPDDSAPVVPEGMMEIWTIERELFEGVLIDDIKETKAEAIAEVERRGHPWRTIRLVVPYNKG